MIALLADGATWASLLTLTLLEIVLGIDNLVFLAVVVERLPPARRPAARGIGLALALVLRVALLFAITAILRLTAPVLELGGHAFSWRDLILLGGGLFLLWKGTHEIHAQLEGRAETGRAGGHAGFLVTVLQIALLDIVFSIDSVVTAVGMANRLPVMVAAVVIAMLVMLAASGSVAGFIARHPTVRMLALAFLLLIGMSLVADGMGIEIPKAMIYAAIGFSLVVEALNAMARARRVAR